MSSLAPHAYWVTSRAAGVLVMLLGGASVTLGLTMGGRMIRRAGPQRRVIHETVSLGALIALAVHGLALTGDRFLHPSVADVLVPFQFAYEKGWTTLGIIAGWAMVACALAYYARNWVGGRWKVVHRLTLVAWLAGVCHALGEGTDAHETWFLAVCALSCAPPLVALGVRLADRGLAEPVSARAARAPSKAAAPVPSAPR